MSRMSEEARRQREEEVEITIGQVGKARAAEITGGGRTDHHGNRHVSCRCALGITEHRTGSKRADETPR